MSISGTLAPAPMTMPLAMPPPEPLTLALTVPRALPTATDSPGSAFKAFAVAAGIKDGFSLKDTFDGNSPYYFPDGSKAVNEGGGNGQDYGTVSLTKATEQSINTAFIDLTASMKNGPGYFVIAPISALFSGM